MKIALIRKKYYPERGGAEKVAAYFVQKFTERGHSVTVFAESFHSEETELFKWVKVPRGTGFSKTSSFHRQVQQTLNQNNRRQEFDIIYAMCRTFPVDVFRITEQLHSEWLSLSYSKWAWLNPRHRSILKLERETLNPANIGYVVANSELIKRQVIERFKFPEEQISIVHNGINREVYFPAAKGEKTEIRRKFKLEDRFICMFAASNFKMKGLAEAIKVIASLSEPLRKRIMLMVVGSDKPEPFLKVAETCGVGGNIIFTGMQKNIRNYYIASDLLLYPSHYETFGNICLEACACGIPVLTTKMVGASEMITDNRNGFVINSPSDIDKMAEFLAAYMELPASEHRKFSHNAVESSSDYNWNKHADDLEKIFQNIIARKTDGKK